LLKEGDEVVEWMGDKIVSERQFYCGIARCPTVWLTLKRTETSFERQQRLRIDYLERLLQLSPELPNHGLPIGTNVSTIVELKKPSSAATNTVTATSKSSTSKKQSAPSETQNLDLATPSSKKLKKVSERPSFSTLTSSFTEPSQVAPLIAMSEATKKRKRPKVATSSSSLQSSGQIRDSGVVQNSEEIQISSLKLTHATNPTVFDAVFLTPLDCKDLPPSWRKASNGKSTYFEHIDSGLKLYNSREMKRVLQLLNCATVNSQPCMSVQDALKQAHREYLEYKKRLAVTTKESAPLKSADVILNTLNGEAPTALQPAINQKPKFHFDIQTRPRGWLRFDDVHSKRKSVYWKHCATQHKVKDAEVMPRVLQLLEQQLRGSNITVKEAIKQAKFEKENGSYIVELFDSNESSLFIPPILSAAKPISTVSSKKKEMQIPKGRGSSTLLEERTEKYGKTLHLCPY